MAASRGSATTLISSFPAILPPQALHTSETRNLNNPESTEPISSRERSSSSAQSPAIQESTFAPEGSIRGLRAPHRSPVARPLAVLSDGESTWFWPAPGTHCWPLRSRESGHIDIVWRAPIGSLRRCPRCARWRAIAAVALGTGDRSQISAGRAPAPLLEAGFAFANAALALGVFGFLYVPFLNRGRIPLGSLGGLRTGIPLQWSRVLRPSLTWHSRSCSLG